MSKRSRFWVVALAALVLAGLTARLGWWQLDRAEQKRAYQAAIDERGALPALVWQDLARSPADLEAQRHRLIRLAGYWQPDATVFLDNRPMGGRAGFYVVTPLTLPDGSAVLVQRGWTPRDPIERTRVSAPPLPRTPVIVEGRIAGPPSRLFEFEGADQGSIRQNLDIESFAAEHRLRLRATSIQQLTAVAGKPDGLLRDWPRPATGVAKHHGYAFQWFSLSALTVGLFLWFQIIRPRRQKKSS